MTTEVMTAQEAYDRREEWSGKFMVRPKFPAIDYGDMEPANEWFRLRDGVRTCIVRPGEQVQLVPIPADPFDARLDALLTMPEGWEIVYLGAEDNYWFCTLGGTTADAAVSAKSNTAREAIEAAKQMAQERDAK